MSERIKDPSTTAPAGEDQGAGVTFTVAQIAVDFGVHRDAVNRAAAGELGRSAGSSFDSRDAQRLAAALLADRPLADQQAALMELGAFTPRYDSEWGLGDTVSGEESDRLAASPDTPDDNLSSKRSSYDPATQDAREKHLIPATMP